MEATSEMVTGILIIYIISFEIEIFLIIKKIKY